MIKFDTDYMEGAHPQVMARLVETNLEHTVGYGKDEYSEHARQLIRDACGCPHALVQFLIGGTQTNDTVISALLHSHEGVLAAETAHINAHESGAIEHSGHKVLTLPAHDGKITAQQIHEYITNFYNDESYEHMVAPGMVSITHPTEYGTLYSLAALTAISETCHRHQIPLYMDGARLGYALASGGTDVTLQDIARLCDVFYIGGTKVGLLFGETVVAPNPQLLPHFFSHMKLHGALIAKGRLLGVQFETLFTDGLYGKIGQHAVRLAQKLRQAFIDCQLTLAIDSPTNQQFVVLPNALMDKLAEYSTFEMWGPRGEQSTTIRFVTSWATSEDDVNEFIGILRHLTQK